MNEFVLSGNNLRAFGRNDKLNAGRVIGCELERIERTLELLFIISPAPLLHWTLEDKGPNRSQESGLKQCCGGLMKTLAPPIVSSGNGLQPCLGVSCSRPRGCCKIVISPWGQSRVDLHCAS
uniref:Uncharacterized protein n=1 Tax=Knipowitschia caucasica TaxID=637954 RepID=A0AAV2L317_KNICA